MVKAYLDPSLDVLRDQLRAKYPGVVIYWIGDEEHRQRKSDHNPEADGSVDAIDVMIGPHFSKTQAQNLFNTLHEWMDYRIANVIFDRHIFSTTVHPGIIRNFDGDPHTDHVHISRNDIDESSRKKWQLETRQRHVEYEDVKGKWPVLHKGDVDPIDDVRHVWRLQRALGFPPEQCDGVYGPKTEARLDDWEIPGRPKNRVNREAWAALTGLRQLQS